MGRCGGNEWKNKNMVIWKDVLWLGSKDWKKNLRILKNKIKWNKV